MIKQILSVLFAVCCLALQAQNSMTEPTTVFLMHSSGLHMKCGADNRGQLEAADASSPAKITVIPDGTGYFRLQAAGTSLYLALSGQWNTVFQSDPDIEEAMFSIDVVNNSYLRFRCLANGKYLGTDDMTPDSWVYADKNGQSPLHWWFFSDDVHTLPPTDTQTCLVVPSLVRQHFDGWGVSLCWWARMCGTWEASKVNTLVNWLVSPTGLNYSIFRYNIGGGDDPDNANCTPHHMGEGKGLRAEMEGFKDSSDDDYHWDRDEGQRNIMLKIRDRRPDAVFEAFSNSAPFYMTYSGCVAGNANGGKDNLRPEYYEEFAHYLVDVCRHYKDEYGLEFKTLEPFNEAMTNFWYAGGSQEGCHFDVASQVNFLRTLSPILQQSGLSTVISASDETSVGQSVADLRQYKQQGVLPLVSQWNTHTYSVSTADRARLAYLCHVNNIPLWMSEVGAGGSGLGGNLSLAQKLIDDMRYLQPRTWIDWQVMEEWNDQWCTVTGNFADQTMQRNKNYYVRQQFSRFIPAGYSIVTSLADNSLAALSGSGDTLVVVILNQGGQMEQTVDLRHFTDFSPKARFRAYRTTSSDNCQRFTDFGFNAQTKLLTVTMPAQSVMTFVIPTRPLVADEEKLRTDTEYLIVPRHAMTRAITVSAEGNIALQDIDYSDAQRWTLVPDGQAYQLKCADGRVLTAHRAESSTSLTAQTALAAEQTFTLDVVDFPYQKIAPVSEPAFALDLVREETAAGTAVGLWQYDNTDAPTHRQWMLVPLTPLDETATDIELVQTPESRMPHDGAVYDLQGRRVNLSVAQGVTKPGLYIVNGRKVLLK